MATTREVSVLLSFSVLCIAHFVSADYHSRYEKWEEMYKKEEQKSITDESLRLAYAKSVEFPSLNMDEKDAVKIVNLYTQREHPTGIYNRLNGHYRNDSNNVPILWSDFAALLNDAIDMLQKYSEGCDIYERVYRGSTYKKDLTTTEDVTMNFFTSSSLSPPQATKFGIPDKDTKEECEVFLVIDNVYGLYVKKFSNFSYEEEVVMKLFAVIRFHTIYDVDANPSDRAKIDEATEKIGDFPSNCLVKTLALGEYVQAKSKRRRRRDIRCTKPLTTGSGGTSSGSQTSGSSGSSGSSSSSGSQGSGQRRPSSRTTGNFSIRLRYDPWSNIFIFLALNTLFL